MDGNKCDTTTGGTLMKKYDIILQFTLDENEYKRYDKNFDKAMNLIIPYGKDIEVHENEYDEEE